jgi:hypothetical protein
VLFEAKSDYFPCASLLPPALPGGPTTGIVRRRSLLEPEPELTVRRVVEAVALYSDRGDLFQNYPELELDDVQQVLAFAAANLEGSADESNAA